jgi:hypothetical protein
MENNRKELIKPWRIQPHREDSIVNEHSKKTLYKDQTLPCIHNRKSNKEAAKLDD